MPKISNAQILGADLSFGEPNGMFCMDLIVHYDVFTYNIGGNTALSTTMIGALIPSIMYIVGVTEWSQLEGKYIRVIRENNRIVGIKNITKEIGLNFNEFYRSFDEDLDDQTSVFLDDVSKIISKRGFYKS